MVRKSEKCKKCRQCAMSERWITLLPPVVGALLYPCSFSNYRFCRRKLFPWSSPLPSRLSTGHDIKMAKQGKESKQTPVWVCGLQRLETITSLSVSAINRCKYWVCVELVCLNWGLLMTFLSWPVASQQTESKHTFKGIPHWKTD